MSLLPQPDLVAAAERATCFAELHRPGTPLLMANAWDAGSAKILAHLGYAALATTSSGFANSLGRHDGGVTRDEAIAHGAALAAATPLPVSADLENGFAHDPTTSPTRSPSLRRPDSPAVRSRIGTLTSE